MTTPRPPRIYPANSMQLTLVLMQGGQEANVVLGGITDGAAGAGVSLAEAWRDAAWTQFRALIGAEVSCAGAILRETHQPEGQVVEVGAPTNPLGTAFGSPTVAAGSTVIKWSTNRGGRSGKGRTFLPGLMTVHIENVGRSYVAAHHTATKTAATNYLNNAALSTAGITPAVLSFTKGLASEITAGSLAPVVGVQRRRMRG